MLPAAMARGESRANARIHEQKQTTRTETAHAGIPLARQHVHNGRTRIFSAIVEKTMMVAMRKHIVDMNRVGMRVSCVFMVPDSGARDVALQPIQIQK